MIFIQKRFFFVVVFFVLVSCVSIPKKPPNPLVLSTIYGDFTITEPVLIDLIEHPMMQRLKKVRQYGVSHFVIKPEEYHRFEHSIGVFVLLRQYGASLNEQIAGLLHDTSHTVFSHVGDWVFDHPDGKASYQDDNHDSFLQESGLAAVLLKHGIKPDAIHHKHNDFRLLEQDLPDLCLDRIEYNLQGGLREHLITHDEMRAILADLRFENGNWFFSNPILAEKFAQISLYHTEKVWGSARELIAYSLTAQALKAGLKTGHINIKEIIYGTDDVMWKKLTNSTEPEIVAPMAQLLQLDTLYASAELDSADMVLKAKFRGVDPLIKQGTVLKRLSAVNTSYNESYQSLKTLIEKGYGLQMRKTPLEFYEKIPQASARYPIMDRHFSLEGIKNVQL